MYLKKYNREYGWTIIPSIERMIEEKGIVFELKDLEWGW